MLYNLLAGVVNLKTVEVAKVRKELGLGLESVRIDRWGRCQWGRPGY